MSDRSLIYLNFNNDRLLFGFKSCSLKDCKADSAYIIAKSWGNKNNHKTRFYRSNHCEAFYFYSCCINCINCISESIDTYTFYKIYTIEEFKVLFPKDVKKYIT